MIKSLFIGNEDGGIYNPLNKVPSSDSPVVVVGLGGTGIDAITRLKTKLHRQIRPDNQLKVETDGEEPEYGHIKFLGIDADKSWLEGSGLLREEILDVQRYDYNELFASDQLDRIKEQGRFQWMNVDYMASHLPPQHEWYRGLPAVRQVADHLRHQLNQGKTYPGYR